jgi:Protein of unknown function (DUF2889)
MLMSWPGGLGTELSLQGRARDLLTPDAGQPEVLDEITVGVVTGRERDIQRIDTKPVHPDAQRLVGMRAGGNLRVAIAQAMADEAAAGTPLYLLLDDLAGATLISGFIYFRWREEFPVFTQRIAAGPGRVMRDVCSGFRDGSGALTPEGAIDHVSENTPPSSPLVDAADPLGWHKLGDHPAIAMRRARRIDVWMEDGVLRFDTMFRDSCWSPAGEEEVLHEYEIVGSADPIDHADDGADGVLRTVTATPRVLPYPECPGAAPNAAWMQGTPLRSMRTAVLDQLRNANCCTHLNDGLRALAEIPILAAHLSQ